MRMVLPVVAFLAAAHASAQLGAQQSTLQTEGLPGRVYFMERPLMHLPDFDRLEPVRTIYTKVLNVHATYDNGFPGIPDRKYWFAIDYQGTIYISAAGQYTFELISDDGAKLYIDDKVIVDNDHGLGDFTGLKKMNLESGEHRMRLSYWQGPEGHHCIMLRLLVTVPGNKQSKPFDIREFYPHERIFTGPPDPTLGRVRLKDVIAAQDGVSNRNIVAFVRSELSRHASDKSIAKSLENMRPRQKFEASSVDELESEGAGPETVAALDHLREISSGLLADTSTVVYKFPPIPMLDEQRQFFRELSRNALHYTASLPDFICTENIRRYTSPSATANWKLKDTLTVKLTYFENHEKYELALINGHKSSRDYESTGGTVAEGDFGTQLLEVFDPDTETKFQWDHWTRLRGRLTQVFSFRTAAEHSHYRLAIGVDLGRRGFRRDTAVAGRHGFIYADNETRQVMRVSGEADIPASFVVVSQWSVLDYGMAQIGDRQFLLPIRSEQRMTTANQQFKNIEEFQNYRKFSGDSTISFADGETPAAAPAK